MDESLMTHEEFDFSHHRNLRERQIWVFGVIQEGTGDLRLYMMTRPNTDAIEQILKAVVEPYTVVDSDAHPMYKSIQWETMRLAQLIHIHKGSRDLFHSNYIEGVWWVLKKQIRKMYSQIQSKGIENFVFEAWFRRERDRS